MLLLEFAAQGIRGVAPAGGRATLRPGYNVIGADGAALRRLLEALLYPAPEDAEALVRGGVAAGSGPVRAGLTLVGNDRITYRLVRDLGGGCQLQRFDVERRAFAPVAQELAAVARALGGAIGAAPRGRFEALLSIGAAELPSRVAGEGRGGAAALGPPPRAALSPEARLARLEALREEAGRARELEATQAELDAQQARLGEVAATLEIGARHAEALAEAERALAGLAPVAAVRSRLGDPAARLAALDRSAARRDEALGRLGAEREALEAARAAGAPRPPWDRADFVAGLVAGLALLLAGAAGGGQLRYLALLDLPALGWPAFVAYRWVGALEGWDRLERRRAVLDDWEGRIAAQYARDAAEVGAELAALGLASTAELRERLEALAGAERLAGERRAALEAWEGSPEARSAGASRAEIVAAVAAAEARLGGGGAGIVRDARAVEAEIARLEAEGAAGSGAPEPRRAAAPAAPHSGDPLRGLLERASAELGGSPAAVARGVASRASQALGALSLARFSAIAVDDRANLQVVAGGRPAPAGGLAPAERDLVFLAVKLALLEQALAGGRGVALIDEAFAGLPDAARRAAGRILRQLAKVGQVLHATADPAFRESADHLA